MSIIRIGIIADVQYADVEDVQNHNKTAIRRYRKSLVTLRNAVLEFAKENVDFVADLGDAIDGYHNHSTEEGVHALTALMIEWNKIPSIPVLHLLGNHELYKFTRKSLAVGVERTSFHCQCPTGLKGDNPGSFYYSFCVPNHTDWRIVVLDPYEQSVMTNGGGRIGHELTLENGGLDPQYSNLCQQNNPNNIFNGSNYFAGLEGVGARWAPFNGGMGPQQLVWLENVLVKANLESQNVIVLSHVILHPKATPCENCHTLLWNYHEVLDVFAKHTCVKIVLAGHAHHNGYFYCPQTNVHHVSIPSPLEAPGETVEHTYGILEIDRGKAFIRGRGYVESRAMDIN